VKRGSHFGAIWQAGDDTGPDRKAEEEFFDETDQFLTEIIG